MIDSGTTNGALERPQDAGTPPAGIYKRWMMELELADKHEHEWRKDVEKILDIYSGKKKTPFNILLSNVQTIAPALYSQTPRPDVRRRFRDDDPVGRDVSDVLERGLSASEDCYDFDHEVRCFIDDALLTGRGVPWVEYESINETQPQTAEDGSPVLDQMGQPVTEQVQVDEQVRMIAVEWDRYRQAPVRKWRDMPWVARKHLFNRDEMVKEFGDLIGNQIALDWVPDGAKDKKDDDQNVLKRGEVWEIWDKPSRTRIWIAPTYKAGSVRVDHDPLGLEGFFPCPRPIYTIPRTDSLIPSPEYKIYEFLADQLNTITRRINSLLKQLKARGIYDSTLGQTLGKMMDEADGGMVPSNQATAVMQAGGLDKAIWMYPVEAVSVVLDRLYTAAENTKNTIYEITGIADIMRGSSLASETATAQRIKAQFGSLRIQARQAELQRVIRDVFRIKAEIMAEKFSQQSLQLLTSQAISDDDMKLLRSDLNRKIRVDVETDSTIAADQESAKQNVTELLTAVPQFLTAWGPILQTGAVSIEVPKAMLLWAIRQFKTGREVEDAINTIGQQQAPAQPGATAPVSAPPGPSANQAGQPQKPAPVHVHVAAPPPAMPGMPQQPPAIVHVGAGA